MKITYRLSEETRKRMFIEFGKTPASEQSVELDETLLTPAHRAHFVSVLKNAGMPSMPRTFAILGYSTDAVGSGIIRNSFSTSTPEYAEMPDQVDPLRLLADDMQRYDAALAQAKVDAAQRHAEREKNEAEAAERRQLEAAQREAERLDAERRREERAAWVAAHGSSRLKKCLAMNYDCQKQYAIERAAFEFPGYVLDYQDNSAWKARSGPSEAALDEAARVSGEIVWLTAEPQTEPADASGYDDEDDGFEPCEAVVVRQYLGKYDLVKMM